jgi:hypothetical protein
VEKGRKVTEEAPPDCPGEDMDDESRCDRPIKEDLIDASSEVPNPIPEDFPV